MHLSPVPVDRSLKLRLQIVCNAARAYLSRSERSIDATGFLKAPFINFLLQDSRGVGLVLTVQRLNVKKWEMKRLNHARL